LPYFIILLFQIMQQNQHLSEGNGQLNINSHLQSNFAINPSYLDISTQQLITTNAKSSFAVTAPEIGNGLRAEYYNNINFTDLKLTRIDSTINFNWGSGSPDTSIAPDTFSVRWTGQVMARYSENYTFFTTSDDGIRLWVNDQLIINRFVDQAATEVRGNISLVAGQKYNIRLEYYENGGDAVARLGWSSTTQVREIIPSSQLFSGELPTATIDATSVNTGGASSYDFKVTYNDDTGIDVASLDDRDILVTGPGSFSQLATLVSVDAASNGTPRTATYRINTPNSAWNFTNNGIYTITQQSNQVSDISGNFAAATNLGTFRVDIPITDAGTGNGLKAEYYNNINFTDLKLTRTDATVNFNWGLSSPDASMAPDTFSVRWTGQVMPLYSENYTFFTTSDDGVRLWIDDQLVVNRYIDQPTTEASGTISLIAGRKYNIRLDYYENGGEAVSRLAWSSNSQVKEIIPRSQLFNSVVNSDTSIPSATLNAGNITTGGASTYTFNVTYSDDTAINTTSLDDNDILVTGPGSFSQLATLVSVDTSSNGTPRTATYRINTPGGSWNGADNGTYTITLQANQVSDTSGNFALNRSLGSFSVNIPTTQPTPTGKGLKAEYYDNIDFTDLKVTAVDSTINFNWGNSSPNEFIGADTFSVRWTGQVQARYSETYNFFTTSDDGIRLWVNNQLIIDRFINQPSTEVLGSIELVAGQKYDIRVDYFENGGEAVARLAWSSASQAKEIIPQSYLFSPPSIPIILLGVPPESVAENTNSVSVNIIRTGEDLSGTSSIRYTTKADTAQPGEDYVETSGTAIFAPGETTKTITIPILSDTLAENDETFAFVIDQPEGAGLGTTRTFNITVDDDDRDYLTFTQPTVSEGDRNAIVTVKRGISTNAASVEYTTVNGTATAGSDFTAVSGTLNFGIGERFKTIAIPLVNNNFLEVNENFTLQFSNASGVRLTSQDKAVITILDDESGVLTREAVVTGIDRPTFIDWIPTTATNNTPMMLIAQKNGVVRVREGNNLLTTPFIDISNQVNDAADRGLLSLAVHPDFANNPYVYLLFTYDPPEVYASGNANNPNTLSGPDERGNRPSRLMRVTADARNNYRTFVPGSEVILLGKNSNWENTSRPDVNSTGNFDTAPSGIIATDGRKFVDAQDYLNNLSNITNIQDYLATDSETHSIGTVRFGTDGSLFVTNGDGTSYNRMDPRSIRVQDLNNLSGKIIRIDPINGQGLPDNPYYNGNPNSNISKVYSSGLRNPFRMAIDKSTNTPYVGDVGWTTWEEVNAGRAKNFGWPYFEGGNSGNIQQREYATLPSAQAFYNSGAAVEAPIYAYQHTSGGDAIFVGDFYTGNNYPTIYQNSLFIGNVSKGTIDSLTLSAQGQVTSVQRFASGIFTPVQMITGPDGNLYYTSVYGNEIGRWRYA
jgi:PA14 domain/Glucose / Sorbosone dehydrogenase/Calx-beta domain